MGYATVEKFMTHKFPAVTLISAPVGTSYGYQYVYFITQGGKLPRELKKNYSTIMKKEKKQTNK